MESFVKSVICQANIISVLKSGPTFISDSGMWSGSSCISALAAAVLTIFGLLCSENETHFHFVANSHTSELPVVCAAHDTALCILEVPFLHASITMPNT